MPLSSTLARVSHFQFGHRTGLRAADELVDQFAEQFRQLGSSSIIFRCAAAINPLLTIREVAALRDFDLVVAPDWFRPPDSLPEIRDSLKRLSLFCFYLQLPRQFEIRTASVGVGCHAGSALVEERLSLKLFCPLVHDVKTTSRAIRFRRSYVRWMTQSRRQIALLQRELAAARHAVAARAFARLQRGPDTVLH